MWNHYEVFYIIKTLKDINITDVEDRIRGIEDVQIVRSIPNDKLNKLSDSSDTYNWSLTRVKFLTDSDPKTAVEYIKNRILKSNDSEGTKKIVGVASATPKPDTLRKYK
jgi:hypothetical protein